MENFNQITTNVATPIIVRDHPSEKTISVTRRKIPGRKVCKHYSQISCVNCLKQQFHINGVWKENKGVGYSIVEMKPMKPTIRLKENFSIPLEVESKSGEVQAINHTFQLQNKSKLARKLIKSGMINSKYSKSYNLFKSDNKQKELLNFVKKKLDNDLDNKSLNVCLGKIFNGKTIPMIPKGSRIGLSIDELVEEVELVKDCEIPEKLEVPKLKKRIKEFDWTSLTPTGVEIQIDQKKSKRKRLVFEKKEVSVIDKAIKSLFRKKLKVAKDAYEDPKVISTKFREPKDVEKERYSRPEINLGKPSMSKQNYYLQAKDNVLDVVGTAFKTFAQNPTMLSEVRNTVSDISDLELNKLADNVNKILEQESFSKLVESLDSFAKSNNSLINYAQDNGLAETWRNISTNGLKISFETDNIQLKWLEKTILFFATLYLFCTLDNWGQAIALLVILLTALGCGTRIYKWIEDNKKDLKNVYDLSQQATAKSQADIDFSEFCGPAAGLIASGACLVFASDDARSIPSYSKMGEFARSFNQVKTMSGALKESINCAQRMIIESFTGIPTNMQDLPEYAIELESWFLGLDLTINNADWLQGYLQDSKNNKALLEEQLNLGNDLLKRMSTLTPQQRGHVPFQINESLRVLRKYLEALTSMSPPQEDHFEPIFVWMFSGTGTGKSSMPQTLLTHIFSTLKPEEKEKYDYNTLLYNYKPDSEFMDGYDKHFGIIIDEMFQNPDPQVLAKQATELIHIVNPLGATANMADLPKKDKIVISSEVVLVTTNRKTVGTIPIECPDALKRRRDIVIEPRVKKQFCNAYGILDSKVWVDYCEKNNKDYSIPTYCEFVVYDKMLETASSTILQYPELVDFCVNKLNTKKRIGRGLALKRADAFKEALAGPINYKQQSDDFTSIRSFVNRLPSKVTGLGCKYLQDNNYPFELWGAFIDITPVPLASTSDGEDEIIEDPFIKNLKKLWCSRDKVFQSQGYVLMNVLLNTKSKLYRSTVLSSYFGINIKENLMLKEVNKKLFDELVLENKIKEFSWSNRFRSWWTNFLKNFPLMPFLVISGVVLTFLGFFLLIKKVTTNNPKKPKRLPFPTPESEASSYGNPRSKVTPFTKIVRRVLPVLSESEIVEEDYNNEKFILQTEEEDDENLNKFYLQACTDANWEDQLLKFLKALLVIKVKSKVSHIIKKRARGILISSGFFVLPRHLISGFVSSDYYLEISGSFGTKKLDFDVIKLSEIGERWKFNDVVLCRIEPALLPAKNIVDLFASESEIVNFSDCYGEIIISRDEHLIRCASKISSQEEFCRKNPDYNPLVNAFFNLYAVSGLKYTASTQDGDCGSPIIKWDNTSKSKILGFHCAGNCGSLGSQGSFGCFIDRDWLKEEMSKYPVMKQQSDDLEPIKNSTASAKYHLLDNAIDVLGRTPNKEFVKVPVKSSNIVPSVLASSIDIVPLTAPTESSFGKGESIHKVLKKYRDDAPLVDNKLVFRIVHMLYYLHFSKFEKCEVLSIDDALNSIGNLDSINPWSSPGFPWVLDKETRNKSSLDDLQCIVKFDGEKYKIISEKFLDKVNYDINLMENNICPNYIWLNNFKDERLPLDKIKDKKIRLFMVAPFDLTVISRMYFGDFISKARECRLEHGMCVGIVPQSMEWDTLARKLLEKNNKFLAFDQKNFDRSIPKEFMLAYFDLVDRMYDEDSRNVRDVLRFVLTCPVMQLEFFRYNNLSSNPSGSPLTSEINSFASLVLLIYNITKMGYTLSDTFRNLYAAIYNDDSVVAFSLDLDIKLLSKQYKEMGMEIVNCVDKTENIEFQSIDQVDFLQRKFRKINGVYIGLLHKHIIIESLLWSRKGKNQNEVMAETVRNAFNELSLYPVDECVEEYTLILSACLENEIKFDITEHMVESLCLSKQEALIGDMFLDILNTIWKMKRTFRVPFSIVDLDSLPNDIVVDYETIDLASKIPFLPKGKFVHGDFKIINSDYQMAKDYKLTFGKEGVIWINDDYEPQTRTRYIVSKWKLHESFIHQKPYHRVLNNCIVWCEWMIGYEIADSDKHALELKQYALKTPKVMGEYKLQAEGELEANEEEPVEDNVRPILSSSDPLSKICPAKVRDFRELLETPTLVSSVKWEDSMLSNTEMFRLNFPSVLLDNVSQFKQKLSYNALFSSDILIRVKVSSSKFQCGTFVLVWVPMAKSGFPSNATPHVFAYTSMPHQLINLSDHDECGAIEVSLTIPYVHINNFIRLSNRTDIESFGEVVGIVLNPLNAAAGDKFAFISVFANFIDIRAFAPTPNEYEFTPIPKSGTSYPKYVLQDESDEKVEAGLLSGPISRLSGFVKLFSGIPVFAKPSSAVSSVLDSVVGVSRFFGFSKPVSNEVTHPYIPRLFTSVSHHDSLDMSVPLSTSTKNSVVIQPSLFGSLVDELNLKYVTKIPQVIKVLEWGLVSLPKDILYTIPVVPTLSEPITMGDYVAAQLTPVGYVSLAAMFWKGSLNFRLRAICTDFHRGVLLVSFIPCATVTSFPELAKTVHYKLDLSKKCSERMIEFNIPFISDQLYHRIPQPFDVINLNSFYATGSLVFTVLNGLVAPANVSQKIQLNLEMWAGDDFSLAVPQLTRLLSYNFGTNNVPTLNVAPELDGFIDLSDFLQSDDRENKIFGSVEPLPTFNRLLVDSSSIVMGEDLYNIRDFLKIFSTKFDTSVTIPAGEEWSIIVPIHSFVPNNPQPSSVDRYITFYDYFMRLYRFSRGSIRQKIVCTSGEFLVTVLIDLEIELEPWVWSKGGSREGSPWAMTHSKLNPTLEYSIPFYSRRKMIVHGNVNYNRNVMIKVKNLGVESNFTMRLVESIGDDFSAGYFSSPPVVWLKPNVGLAILNVMLDGWNKGVKMDKPDGYYDPVATAFTQYPGSIKSGGTMASFSGQKFYYEDNTGVDKWYAIRYPKATKPYATADCVEIGTVISPNDNLDYNWVVIYWPNSVYRDKGSYSYKWRPDTLWSGTWFYIQTVQSATQTGYTLYFISKKGPIPSVNGNLRRFPNFRLFQEFIALIPLANYPVDYTKLEAMSYSS